MTIPAYRLPENIERGSGFGPTFKNIIQEAISGHEQRFAQWTKCRGAGDLSWGLQTSSDLTGDYAAILAMWMGHRGSLYPFRFKDWTDYQCEDELFGVGDGSTVDFQLTKTYDPSLILLNSAGSLFYVRVITLLATVPVIAVDGATKTVVTDYNISSSGLVTFTSPPANDKDITWTGEFDIPVRFDAERLPVIMNEGDLVTIQSIPIREVIGES